MPRDRDRERRGHEQGVTEHEEREKDSTGGGGRNVASLERQIDEVG